jgi:hypothetical protein
MPVQAHPRTIRVVCHQTEREFVGVSALGGSVAAVGESAGKAMNAGACSGFREPLTGSSSKYAASDHG